MNTGDGYDNSYLKKVAQKRATEDLFTPKNDWNIAKLGVFALILLLLGIIGYLLMKNNSATLDSSLKQATAINYPSDNNQVTQGSYVLSDAQNKSNSKNASLQTKQNLTADTKKQAETIVQDVDNVVAVSDKVVEEPKKSVVKATKEAIVATTNTPNKMSDEDIARIAQMVVSQIEKANQSKPSTDTNRLNKQSTESKAISAKSSQKISNYNKVTLNKNTNKTNNQVANLYGKNYRGKKSAYTKSTASEFETRRGEMRYYSVKDGDTLSNISIKVYGNAKYFNKIFEANPDILRNANLIYVGQKLRVPEL